MATGEVKISQETNYPWDGVVRLTIEPEAASDFALHIRIPGWTRNEPVPSDLYRYQDSAGEPATLQVNGNPVELELERGFAVLHRSWRPGDLVELELPMPVRRVVSHERVEANRGRVAIECGPLVYCAEGIDNGGSVLEMTLSDDETFTVEHDKGLLGGVSLIRSGGKTLIPYYAWGHRGVGEMAVWLRRG
jgi:DUF1680 family protein